MNMKTTTYIRFFIAGAVCTAIAVIPLRVAAGTDETPQSEESAPAEPNVIVIDPLFDYPQAPEDITDLAGKSNYLMQHFWDTFDFKSKTAVDQIALIDAFRVYSVPMQWAEKEETYKSVDRLIENLSKNPTLLLQFTKAAEENLYGPRSSMWIDEIYLKFLDAIVKNKKISDTRKARYILHHKLLTNTLEGNVPPQFEFVSPVGNPETFTPGLLTVIEFGDPGCSDCRMAKLKMDIDVTFSSLVEKGKINVLFIIPDPSEGWQTELADYPKHWHVGASDTVSDIYDIRLTPTFYVIGTDGKIIAKNVTVDRAMKTAIENVK